MKLLFKLFEILKWLIPTMYLVGALPIWFFFANANPDGLADLGLILYTFPIVYIGTFVLKLEFPYVAGGYIEAHALYFWPAVFLLAALFFVIFLGLQKLTQRHASNY